jgi:hypothetical protein
VHLSALVGRPLLPVRGTVHRALLPDDNLCKHGNDRPTGAADPADLGAAGMPVSCCP